MVLYYHYTKSQSKFKKIITGNIHFILDFSTYLHKLWLGNSKPIFFFSTTPLTVTQKFCWFMSHCRPKFCKGLHTVCVMQFSLSEVSADICAHRKLCARRNGKQKVKYTQALWVPFYLTNPKNWSQKRKGKKEKKMISGSECWEMSFHARTQINRCNLVQF